MVYAHRRCGSALRDSKRQPPAPQHAVVGGVARKKTRDHRHCAASQDRSVRIQTLLQRRARGQQPDAWRLLEELVATHVLDGVKVALALHQQAQLAAYDVAGGQAGARRQDRIDVGQRRSERLQEMILPPRKTYPLLSISMQARKALCGSSKIGWGRKPSRQFVTGLWGTNSRGKVSLFTSAHSKGKVVSIVFQGQVTLKSQSRSSFWRRR